MNRPDSPADSGASDLGAAPDEDDDEDFGGHIGNPQNLESGAPAYADEDDDDSDDEAPSTS